MLSQKQIKEIREHLEKAQNPVFFFDNDQDGLCSFLLLQRYLGHGKGVPIKSFPDLSIDYFRKIRELNADYVFILDKPNVSEEFFKEVAQINIPVVWIDHHDVDVKIPENVSYYNPILNKEKTNEPVTDICYHVTKRREDLWIAVVGCISDHYVPVFYEEFEKKYHDLISDSKDPFDIFYRSGIGRIARILGFSLKDRITNVVIMMKFLMNATNPYEVLEESNKNYLMHKRFNEINRKVQKLVEKAESIIDSGRLLFFQYGGDLSISSDLSNELIYKFPKKIVVVVYVTGSKANISVRGDNVRELVLNALEGLDDATGGGHEMAVGAKVKLEDLEKFRSRLEKLVE